MGTKKDHEPGTTRNVKGFLLFITQP